MKLSSVLMFASLLAPVAAQPGPGDLVLSDSGGDLLYVTWPNGTLRVLVPQLNVMGMVPDQGNDAMVCHLADGRIVRVAADGSTTQLAQLPVTGGGPIAPDQDGSYLAASASSREIYRIAQGVVTTFYSQPVGTPIHGLDRNGDSGDFVFVDDSTNVYRLDRVTGQKSFFGFGAEYTPHSLIFVEGAGEVWGDYPSGNTILRWDSGGQWLGVLGFGGGYCLVSDEPNDRVFAAATPLGTRRDVLELSSTGRVRVAREYTGRNFCAVGVWASRQVAFATSGTRGSTATIELGFGRSPSRAYCAVLALANRPGIALGTQFMNLQPDPLFFATACSALPGFAGNTDAAGRATASFPIPAGVPLPFLIHASAVAVNAAVPGGFDVGNVDVVLLQ